MWALPPSNSAPCREVIPIHRHFTYIYWAPAGLVARVLTTRVSRMC
jgi:hypothetical protein